MSLLWESETELAPVRPTVVGWGIGVVRTVILVVLIVVCLIVLMLVRLIEKPVFGLHRPITPHITQFVCRSAFVILGIGFSSIGGRMKQPGAVVANHVSWLDIFALNARKRIYFVSKSEVANWPGIGVLAKATGTVFIDRDRKQAKQQQEVFESRLLAGHKLLFFPEGTSTDGLRVIPFKSTLFQAFFSPHLREEIFIQPVTVVYRAPKGADPRYYGWWGEMEFGPHLWKTLTTVRQGRVTVVYHTPVKVSDFANRKTLATHVENMVRSGLPKEFSDAAGAS